MQARDDIVISAAGKAGFHAAVIEGHENTVAQYGCSGADGHAAGSAHPGAPGHDIRVCLSYNPAEAEVVQVSGEANLTGARWKVPNGCNLHLDASGGAGGNGGRGGDGQQGGQGSPGRNATRYSDATSGGQGAQGGKGGSGTNGANGGDAGNIFISVHENDLDCLVPITWDIDGGKGGLSGTHGHPGTGGVGGKGGKGGRWEERYGDKVHVITRSAGAPGAEGRPGIPQTSFLSAGTNGKNGFSSIKVIRSDHTEAIYKRRYVLQISHFDIIDENRDGINEPGEHIIVHNLRVKNIGDMPSPTLNKIRVLIAGTQWLDPVMTEPLELPPGISAGKEVEVPGQLRAYIRSETASRPVGKALAVEDSVRLIATFYERLNRPIPEFTSGTKIVIQYPLFLTAPKCLDCVPIGKPVRFHWTLKNISTKAQGSAGDQSRYLATRFVDQYAFFNLTHNQGERFVDDELDAVTSQEEVFIDQDFTVSNFVRPYSMGRLGVELILGHPQTGKYQVVMRYNIDMQISSEYRYNPDSSFLLVVNSSTPNHAIRQSIDFIVDGLKLGVDVFNLSLVGSFKTTLTDGIEYDVLSLYQGKSIIVFGNAMNYFGSGQRDPWTMMNPDLVSKLSKAGTSFSFPATINAQGLQEWGAWMRAPPIPASANAGNIAPEQLRKVLEKIKTSQPGGESYSDNHKIAARKKSALFWQSIDSRAKSKSEKTAKQLNQLYPLRRFVATHFVAQIPNGKIGEVAVSEVVPPTAHFQSSTLLHGNTDANESLGDFHAHMITASLPFPVLATMFWNIAAGLKGSGIEIVQIYKNAQIKTVPNGSASVTVEDLTANMMHIKVCRFVCHAVATRIVSEIAHFLALPPWPDVIPKDDILSELPLLNSLLKKEAEGPAVESLEGSEPVITALGVILGLLKSNSVTKRALSKMSLSCRMRKARLRGKFKQQLRATLASRYSPSILTAVQEAINQAAGRTNKIIKASAQPKKKTGSNQVLAQRLAEITGQPGAGIIDLIAHGKGSVSQSHDMLQSKQHEYSKLRERINTDSRHAENVLRPILNPED